MTDKVLIGRRGSEYGAWVAAPGHDASIPGDKMLLDCNRDSLLLHHYSETILTGEYVPVDDGYFFVATIYFPALSYVPLAIPFFSRYGWGDQGVRYPPTADPQQPDEPLTASPGRWLYDVYNNRVHLETDNLVGGEHVYVSLYVFKNRAV